MGIFVVRSTFMFKEELKKKMEELEQELSTKEEEYIRSVKLHKDYNRRIRDSIGELKKMIDELRRNN